MKSLKIYLSFCAFIALQSMAFAQAEIGTKTWSLQLNVQHQDLAGDLVFGQLGVVEEVRIRPLYSLDVEYAVQRKPKRKRLFTAHLGYYHNLYHERWLSAKAGIGSEWQLFKGLYLGMRTELGAVWAKATDLQYAYNGEQWVRTDNAALYDRGLFISPRLDLGYRIVEGEHPIDVALNGSFSIADATLGLAPYYAFGVGVRYGL